MSQRERVLSAEVEARVALRVLYEPTIINVTWMLSKS